MVGPGRTVIEIDVDSGRAADGENPESAFLGVVHRRRHPEAFLVGRNMLNADDARDERRNPFAPL
jgi:hypothetical protein